MPWPAPWNWITRPPARNSISFWRSIRLSPNVHFRYGALLYIQDADRGIDEIKQAVALNPNHVPALVSLSTIYLKREDFKAAVDYGERAVKAGPEDFSTHLVLGRALLASEEPARAAAELEQTLKLNPNAPEAHFSLAKGLRPARQERGFRAGASRL